MRRLPSVLRVLISEQAERAVSPPGSVFPSRTLAYPPRVRAWKSRSWPDHSSSSDRRRGARTNSSAQGPPEWPARNDHSPPRRSRPPAARPRDRAAAEAGRGRESSCLAQEPGASSDTGLSSHVRAHAARAGAAPRVGVAGGALGWRTHRDTRHEPASPTAQASREQPNAIVGGRAAPRSVSRRRRPNALIRRRSWSSASLQPAPARSPSTSSSQASSTQVRLMAVRRKAPPWPGSICYVGRERVGPQDRIGAHGAVAIAESGLMATPPPGPTRRAPGQTQLRVLAGRHVRVPDGPRRALRGCRRIRSRTLALHPGQRCARRCASCSSSARRASANPSSSRTPIAATGGTA